MTPERRKMWALLGALHVTERELQEAAGCKRPAVRTALASWLSKGLLWTSVEARRVERPDGRPRVDEYRVYWRKDGARAPWEDV